MVKENKKDKKGQMKIQQMAFMLIAVTLFFVLAGLFFLRISFFELQSSAEFIAEKNALLLVSKLANSPEFSCENAFGGAKISCVDGDKIMALKNNINKYSGFWGVSGIEIRKIYPAENQVECTSLNYPNCTDIQIFSGSGRNSTQNSGDFSLTGRTIQGSVLTGMTVQGSPCPCDDGEDGIYAYPNYFSGAVGVYTGYRWKCIDGKCYKACGPGKENSYVCPDGARMGGIVTETIGCFKGNEVPGRCVTNVPLLPTWRDAFSPDSPTTDACVFSLEGEWFIPHGGYNEMLWTHEGEANLPCECGSGDYKYDDTNCHPAFCSNCCEHCFNNKQDCGETSVDKGPVCEVCTDCDDFSPTETPSDPPLISPPKKDQKPDIPISITGVGVSNFVALCRIDGTENQIQERCELARIIVYYGGED